MSNKVKLTTILNLVKEHNLTAYQIAKFTKSSVQAVQKILNNQTKSPTENTLNDILEAIYRLLGEKPEGHTPSFYDYTKSVERELIDTQKLLIDTQKKHIDLLTEKYEKSEIEKRKTPSDS